MADQKQRFRSDGRRRGGALVGQQNMAKVEPGVTAAQEVKGGF